MMKDDKKLQDRDVEKFQMDGEERLQEGSQAEVKRRGEESSCAQRGFRSR